MKIFDNPKPAVYMILAFLVGFFLLRSCEVEASEATLEIGPTFSGEFNGGMGLVYTERFNGTWDVGTMIMSDQTWNDGNSHAGNNGGLFGQRIVRYKSFEMGLGASYWINQSALIGDEFAWALSLGWQFNDHASLRIRHWSNAGTVDRNRGQDILTFGWTF